MGLDVSSLISNTKQNVQILNVSMPGKPSGSTLIEFDACVSETHTSETNPTEFEVETGETISDHIIVKPRNLRIQAIITDTPFSLLNRAMGLLTTGIAHLTPSTAKLGQYAPATVLAPALVDSLLGSLGKDARKSVLAHADLVNMQKQKLPVMVVTSLHSYNNMWIKKISVPRDVKTGRMIVVDIDFVQLLLVKPSKVLLTTLANANLGSKENDGGDEAGGTNEYLEEGQKRAKQSFKALTPAGGT